MCKLFPAVRLLAVAVLMFLCASCSEDAPGFIVPTPDDNKDNTQTENPKPDDGKDDVTDEPAANLCDEEFLGQKPMIIAITIKIQACDVVIQTVVPMNSSGIIP